MFPNAKVYYLSMDSAKKWSLIIDSVQVFNCFHYGHFLPFWASGGALGGAVGSPQGPYETLNLHTYPHPVSSTTASSLGKFMDFGGLPIPNE